MNKDHYSVKNKEYFSNVRKDIISLIPSNPAQKILEIGAGGGNTLLYIKENGIAAEVMGIELMKIENSNQYSPGIDKFQVANIERDEIDAEENYFDVILCADVLEHLTDPWAAVAKIQRYLKKSGLLIASVPNIREVKTLFAILLKGEFRYQTEGGIMDRTHLRFFCKKDIYQLLHTSTLTPIFSKPNFMMKEVPEGKKRRILNLVSFRLFENFLAVQYLFIAKKNG
jgi:2-polyprenyl-3-methyl-5-hydroxy-6-metoxy-1,4-benzoquinol methylase